MQSVMKLDENTTLHIEWMGGPYIELGTREGHPVEVINVYDYEKGEVSIPFRKSAMRKAVNQWIFDYNDGDPDESGKDRLLHDIHEHWGFY